MGRLSKKLFWCFFLAMIPFVIPKNCNLHRPPITFLPISQRFLTNIWCRYFSLNIWVVYDQLELDWCIFDQNWAKTRPLHFQIFQILNAIDRRIVQWKIWGVPRPQDILILPPQPPRSRGIPIFGKSLSSGKPRLVVVPHPHKKNFFSVVGYR